MTYLDPDPLYVDPEPPLWTDANRLRVLALWFDRYDATDYADRQRLLDEGPGRNDVQRDLRRIADDLDSRAEPPVADRPRYRRLTFALFAVLTLVAVALVAGWVLR